MKKENNSPHLAYVRKMHKSSLDGAAVQAHQVIL